MGDIIDKLKIDKVNDINEENINFETQLNGDKTEIDDKSKNNQEQETFSEAFHSNTPMVIDEVPKKKRIK